MPEGRIVKALSGFYYVQSSDKMYACKGRGLFRNQNITPLVGDYVIFEKTNDGEGYITEMKPRKNELIRPPIANVTQAVVVHSANYPTFSALLLDRFLVILELKNIKPLILITKKDLATKKQIKKIEQYKKAYEQLGYKVQFLSLTEDTDVEKIIQFFEGETTVLMGQSGVGKSTLLNVINPQFDIKTGEVSTTLGRGRHTTRHVELLVINNGLVADTPGFSLIEFSEIEAEDLANGFVELKEYGKRCKFRSCLHDKEPNCAVKKAVDDGQIEKFRYKHYLSFLQEILSRKPRY